MRKVVLVVEDHDTTRELIRAHLLHAGYRVLTAATGREGLSVAATEKPDLVILDLVTGQVDGQSAIPAYRKERSPSILMLSASGQEDALMEALNQGATAYHTKPCNMSALMGQVRTILSSPNGRSDR